MLKKGVFKKSLSERVGEFCWELSKRLVMMLLILAFLIIFHHYKVGSGL
jgi:hypothetical protein